MIRQTLLLLLIVFSTATLAQPTPVVISVKVEQITGINQKEENYGAVVSQFLKWHEPALALTREERQSGSGTRLFLIPGFVKYMEAKRLNWPSISFFNQQGRTDFENETVSVDEAGNVIYFARFTARGFNSLVQRVV